MSLQPVTVQVFGDARGSHGLAGIGVVVLEPTGKERQRYNTFLGVATPVQAEYRAIVEGIRIAAKAGSPAVLTTCHDAPFRQLTGRSTAQVPEVADLYVQAFELLAENAQIVLRLVGDEEVDLARKVAAVAIDTRGRRTATD